MHPAYNKSLIELLEEEGNLQTKKSNKTAVIWRNLESDANDVQLTYKRVYEEASKLQQILEHLCVAKNTLVAFTPFETATYCLPIIIIGILKHGCAFVPLGKGEIPVKPGLNIGWLITDTGRSTYSILDHSVDIHKINTSVLPNLESPGSIQKDIAYSLTTSGTTGNPKQVFVPHKAIVPNIIYFRDRFNISPDDIVFQSAPSTFDPFVVELFTTFAAGATLLLIPQSAKKQPDLVFRSLVKLPCPSILQATPSLIKSLGSARLRNLLGPESSLKILAFGGENCPEKNMLRLWKHPLNTTRLFSVYGVTEVSCWSTCYEIDILSSEEIILGDILPFNCLQVRSEQDGSVLVEGVGQLCITTGDRMCLVNGVSLENQWHLTGDKVQLQKDGSIVYLGRINDSRIIKKLGQKINLTQIETETIKTCLVDNCVVVPNVLKNVKLVLFVTSSKLPKEDLEVELLYQLQKVLPPVCVPEAVICVEALYLTQNGKLDVQRLKHIAQIWSQESRIQDLEVNVLQSTVREAWIVALGLDVQVYIGSDANFILSGGDSAKAGLFYSTLLIKHGIQNENERLMTSILERNFKEVCDTLLDVIAEGEQKTQVILQSPPSDRTLAKHNALAQNKLGRVTLACFKGQVINVLTDSINTQITNQANLTSTINLKEQWKVDFFKCIDASPLLVQFESDCTFVYVGAHSGKFACIDAVLGVERWSQQLPDRIEATASISACGNFIYIGCYDGQLYCLSPQCGSILWHFQTGAMIKSSAVISNNSVIVGSYDQNLYCLTHDSGVLIWRCDLGCGSIFATPVLDKQNLIVATLGGVLASVDGKCGKMNWRSQRGKPYFSSPVLLDKEIFVIGDVSGLVKFVKVCDGSTKSSLCLGEGMFASMVQSNLKVYAASKEKLYCIDWINCEIEWFIDMKTQITSTTFVFNNSSFLLLICLSQIFIIDLAIRTVACQHTFQREIFSSPVVWKENVLVGCRDNYLYSLKIS